MGRLVLCMYIYLHLLGQKWLNGLNVLELHIFTSENEIQTLMNQGSIG